MQETDPWVGKISWRRKWQPTPVFLPGESYGQQSLVGYRLWGRKESDTTEATKHAHAIFNYVDNTTFDLCIHPVDTALFLLFFSVMNNAAMNVLYKYLCGCVFHFSGYIPRNMAQLVENPPAMQETPVQLLGQEDSLEKRQTTHSNILGLPWQLSW